jgi:LysM repeat protein
VAGGRRQQLVRVLAPALFLAVATVAVLLVRSALAPAREAPTTTGGVASAVRRVVNVPARPTRKRFYVIRAGDTLDAVATRLHTSVDRLLALNPGIRPTSLRIGQRIRTT